MPVTVAESVSLAQSIVGLPATAFLPLAVGFMGLGTGYLVYGPQELFGFPRRDERVDFATGMWGIWMPGFMQFITGVFLFLGLTLFGTIKTPIIFMAALAFTSYGVHWFAIGWNRLHRADPRPQVGMCIAFILISVLGIIVFFKGGDHPVGGLFIGLTLVYVVDFFVSLGIGRIGRIGERALGFLHITVGLYLMYLMFGQVLNTALHWHVTI